MFILMGIFLVKPHFFVIASGRRGTPVSRACLMGEKMIAAENSSAPDLKSEINQLKTDRILATATALFAQQGYNNCTVEEIANALGVTKPFVYYRFRDKSDILAAICGKGADLTHAAIAEVVNQTGPASERLEAFCRKFAETVVEYSAFVAVYKSEFSNLRPEDRRGIMEVRVHTDALLQDLLQQGQASGEFDLLDPAVTATSITGMLSFIVDWYRPKPGLPKNKLIDTVTELAMRMAGNKALPKNG